MRKYVIATLTGLDEKLCDKIDYVMQRPSQISENENDN